MNLNDSERIAGVLEARNMTQTDDLDEADVVVFNTCCIRENADNKFYGQLSRLKPLKASRPGLQIAVGGCLAQKDRAEIIARAPYVDVVFGTHNLGRVADLLDQALAQGTSVVEVLDAVEDGGEPIFSTPVVRESQHSSWVTIQVGCNNSCAFCIVPQVRGGEISRPIDEIGREVQGLAKSGVSEITLLGQNVNSYGRDITRRSPLFSNLLEQVSNIDGIRRVRFTSPHPKDFRVDTARAMADLGPVCEHLHLPLQSGSDSVLAAMRRGYSARKFLEKVTMARASIDDLAITTDIIVGFPGETDADFEATLQVASEVGFDGAFTFIFSPRPGTRAFDMVGDFVDPDVVSERFERLKVVIDRSALQRHQARVGRLEEVLVDGVSKKDQSKLSGRTRQNKLVHISFNGFEEELIGRYAQVAIDSAAPHFLRGTLVSLEPPQRARRSLPVLVG